MSSLGSGFRIQRSLHFAIVHNASADDVKAFGSRIERVYQSIHRFCAAAKIRTVEPACKLEVVFFDTFTDYERYARKQGFSAAGTYGFYADADNRAVFYNVANDPEMVSLRRQVERAQQTESRLDREIARTPPSATRITLQYNDGSARTLTRDQARKELAHQRDSLRKLNARVEDYAETINRTVVQHETTHQVLFNIGVLPRGGSSPPWLTEGLAMLFEAPPAAGGSSIGVVNSFRLRDFRSAITGDRPGGAATVGAALAAMRSGRLAPLRDLIGDPSLFDARGQAGTALYAEAWALVHYLQRTRTARFGEYLASLSKRPAGRPVDAAFEIAEFERFFGTPDDRFTERWVGYILALSAPRQGNS